MLQYQCIRRTPYYSLCCRILLNYCCIESRHMHQEQGRGAAAMLERSYNETLTIFSPRVSVVSGMTDSCELYPKSAAR